ncbi:MAG: hypothetical protein R2874_00480 [Desulfobacterales bacterium]
MGKDAALKIHTFGTESVFKTAWLIGQFGENPPSRETPSAQMVGWAEKPGPMARHRPTFHRRRRWMAVGPPSGQLQVDISYRNTELNGNIIGIKGVDRINKPVINDFRHPETGSFILSFSAYKSLRSPPRKTRDQRQRAFDRHTVILFANSCGIRPFKKCHHIGGGKVQKK